MGGPGVRSTPVEVVLDLREARGIPSRDTFGKQDVWAELSLRKGTRSDGHEVGDSVRTETHRGAGKKPKWEGEEGTLRLAVPAEAFNADSGQGLVAVLTLWDEDKGMMSTSHDFIAQAEYSVAELPTTPNAPSWQPLFDKSGDKETGEARLAISRTGGPKKSEEPAKSAAAPAPAPAPASAFVSTPAAAPAPADAPASALEPNTDQGSGAPAAARPAADSGKQAVHEEGDTEEEARKKEKRAGAAAPAPERPASAEDGRETPHGDNAEGKEGAVAPPADEGAARRVWNEGWGGLEGVSHEELLRGPLVLTPLRGEALADRDLMGKQDPYVRAYLEGAADSAQRTKTVSNGGRSPTWRPEHDPILTLPAPTAPTASDSGPVLCVEVLDEDVLSDDVIGTWSCALGPLARAVAAASEPGDAGGAQPVLQEDGRVRLRVPLRHKGKTAGVLHALLAFTVPEARPAAESAPAAAQAEAVSEAGGEGGAAKAQQEEKPLRKRPGKPKRPGKAQAVAPTTSGSDTPPSGGKAPSRGDTAFARSGTLFVVVKEARNLPRSGLMAIDPFVRCCLLPWRRKTAQTGVRPRAGPNPRWSGEDENRLSLPYPGFEAFLLQHATEKGQGKSGAADDSGLPMPVAEAQCLVFGEENAPRLRVEAWDKDTFSDDILGTAEISLRDAVLAPRQTVEDWFPLGKPGGDKSKGKDKGGAAAGEVKLAVTFEPTVAPSVRAEDGSTPAYADGEILCHVMRATGFASDPPRQGYVRAQLDPAAGFLDTQVREAGGGTQLVWDEAVAVPCHQGLAVEGPPPAPPQQAEAEALKGAGEPWADCPRVAPRAADGAGAQAGVAGCTPRKGAVPCALRVSLRARRSGMLQSDSEVGFARVAIADIPAVEPGKPPLDLWLALHGKEGVREVAQLHVRLLFVPTGTARSLAPLVAGPIPALTRRGTASSTDKAGTDADADAEVWREGVSEALKSAVSARATAWADGLTEALASASAVVRLFVTEAVPEAGEAAKGKFSLEVNVVEATEATAEAGGDDAAASTLTLPANEEYGCRFVQWNAALDVPLEEERPRAGQARALPTLRLLLKSHGMFGDSEVASCDLPLDDLPRLLGAAPGRGERAGGGAAAGEKEKEGERRDWVSEFKKAAWPRPAAHERGLWLPLHRVGKNGKRGSVWGHVFTAIATFRTGAGDATGTPAADTEGQASLPAGTLYLRAERGERLPCDDGADPYVEAEVLPLPAGKAERKAAAAATKALTDAGPRPKWAAPMAVRYHGGAEEEPSLRVAVWDKCLGPDGALGALTVPLKVFLPPPARALDGQGAGSDKPPQAKGAASSWRARTKWLPLMLKRAVPSGRILLRGLFVPDALGMRPPQGAGVAPAASSDDSGNTLLKKRMDAASLAEARDAAQSAVDGLWGAPREASRADERVDAQAGSLLLHVSRARGLRNAAVLGVQDPEVVLTLAPSATVVRAGPCIDGGEAPAFDQHFTLAVKDAEIGTIQCLVRTKGSVGHSVLGAVDIPMEEAVAADGSSLWLLLQKKGEGRRRGDAGLGKLLLGFRWVPQKSGDRLPVAPPAHMRRRAGVFVRVLRARGLREVRSVGGQDPFVVARLEPAPKSPSVRAETDPVSNAGPAPDFGAKVLSLVYPGAMAADGASAMGQVPKLVLEVRDMGPMGRQSLIGAAVVSLSGLLRCPGVVFPRRLPLRDAAGEGEYGSLIVDLQALLDPREGQRSAERGESRLPAPEPLSLPAPGGGEEPSPEPMVPAAGGDAAWGAAADAFREDAPLSPAVGATLTARVSKGRNLLEVTRLGTQDPVGHVRLLTSGASADTGVCEDGGRHPVWKATLPLASADAVLEVVRVDVTHQQGKMIGAFEMDVVSALEAEAARGRSEEGKEGDKKKAGAARAMKAWVPLFGAARRGKAAPAAGELRLAVHAAVEEKEAAEPAGPVRFAGRGTLFVEVCEARRLRSVQAVGRQDPFVHLSLDPGEWEGRTRTATDAGKAAVWRQRFAVPATWTPRDRTAPALTLRVLDSGVLGSSAIGEAALDVAPFLLAPGQVADCWLPLGGAAAPTAAGGPWAGLPPQQCVRGKAGELHVRAQFVPEGDEWGAPLAPTRVQEVQSLVVAGNLDVHVVRARGLCSVATVGEQDPFVRVQLLPGGAEAQTQVREDVGRAPEWDEHLVLEYAHQGGDTCDDDGAGLGTVPLLEVSVLDEDTLRNRRIGAVLVPVFPHVLAHAHAWSQWLPLRSGSRPAGELRMGLQFLPRGDGGVRHGDPSRAAALAQEAAQPQQLRVRVLGVRQVGAVASRALGEGGAVLCAEVEGQGGHVARSGVGSVDAEGSVAWEELLLLDVEPQADGASPVLRFALEPGARGGKSGAPPRDPALVGSTVLPGDLMVAGRAGAKHAVDKWVPLAPPKGGDRAQLHVQCWLASPEERDSAAGHWNAGQEAASEGASGSAQPAAEQATVVGDGQLLVDVLEVRRAGAVEAAATEAVVTVGEASRALKLGPEGRATRGASVPVTEWVERGGKPKPLLSIALKARRGFTKKVVAEAEPWDATTATQRPGEVLEEWIPLQQGGGDDAVLARIRYIPGSRGKLRVVVRRADRLRNTELFGRQDPYTVVRLLPGKQQEQTPVRADAGDEVEWQHQVQFDYANNDRDQPEQRPPALHVAVMNENVGPDALIGSVQLSLVDALVSFGEEIDRWYPLSDAKGKAGAGGRVQLSLLYRPSISRSSPYYRAAAEGGDVGEAGGGGAAQSASSSRQQQLAADAGSIAELKKLFYRIDEAGDGSGQVDRGELERAVAKEERLQDLMRRAGMDAGALFQAMDVDASGAVSWNEYAAFVNRLLHTLALEPQSEAPPSDSSESEEDAEDAEGEPVGARGGAGKRRKGHKARGSGSAQEDEGDEDGGEEPEEEEDEDEEEDGAGPGAGRRGRGAAATARQRAVAALSEHAWEWDVEQLALWLREEVGLGEAAEAAKRRGVDGVTLLDAGADEASEWLEVEDDVAARKLQAHLAEHKAAYEAHLADQRAERARESEIAQLDRVREQEEAEARAKLAEQERKHKLAIAGQSAKVEELESQLQQERLRAQAAEERTRTERNKNQVARMSAARKKWEGSGDGAESKPKKKRRRRKKKRRKTGQTVLMGESSPTRLRSTLATGQSVVQRAVMEHLARRYQGAAKDAHAEEEKGKATWKFSYDRTANPGDKHPVLSRDDVLRGEAAATVPTTHTTWAEEPEAGDAAAGSGEGGHVARDERASMADSLPGGAAFGSTGRWSSSFRDWINTLRSEEEVAEERPEALELDFWAGSEGEGDGERSGQASPGPGTPPPAGPSPSPMRASGSAQKVTANGWVDDDSEDELPEEPWYHQVAATFARQRAPIRPLRPVPFYTTTKELLVIVSQASMEFGQEMWEGWCSARGIDPQDVEDEDAHEVAVLHAVYECFVALRNNGARWLGHVPKMTRLKLEGGMQVLLCLSVEWNQFDRLYRELDANDTGGITRHEFITALRTSHVLAQDPAASAERAATQALAVRKTITEGSVGLGNRLTGGLTVSSRFAGTSDATSEDAEAAAVLCRAGEWLLDRGVSLRDMFKGFDRNASRSISVAEFTSLMQLITNKELSRAQVFRIMAAMDRDFERTVSEDEFMRYFCTLWTQRLEQMKGRRRELLAAVHAAEQELAEAEAEGEERQEARMSLAESVQTGRMLARERGIAAARRRVAEASHRREQLLAELEVVRREVTQMRRALKQAGLDARNYAQGRGLDVTAGEGGAADSAAASLNALRGALSGPYDNVLRNVGVTGTLRSPGRGKPPTAASASGTVASRPASRRRPQSASASFQAERRLGGGAPAAHGANAKEQRTRAANEAVYRSGRNTVTRVRMLPHRLPAAPRSHLVLQTPQTVGVGGGPLVPEHQYGHVPDGGFEDSLKHSAGPAMASRRRRA